MKRLRVVFFLLWCGPILSLCASDQIASIQNKLKSAGFYYGEATGEYTNETAAAITRYQIASGLQVTGTLNEETLRSLKLPAGSAADPSAGSRVEGQKAEAWKALRQQDEAFLKQATTAPAASPLAQPGEISARSDKDQLRDFVAGFVVAGIASDVEPELGFYADKADYYDKGTVSKEVIKKDILRYDQRWPVRQYWLDGNVRIQNKAEHGPIEAQYQIRYVVSNGKRQASGKALKTLKIQRNHSGLEIVSVREEPVK